MRLDKKVELIFERIKKISGNSPDLTTRIIKTGFKNIGYMYLESVASDNKVSDFLVQSININNNVNKFFILDNFFNNIYDGLKNSIYSSNMSTIDNYDDLFFYLASGFVIVVVDGFREAIVVEAKETLDRGIMPPTTEMNVKGPKDSFTENYAKNIGLIRKRIKDSKLWFKEVKIGRRTKTKVSVGYITDIADLGKVKLIHEKLKNIDIDAILDSSYIKDFLSNDSRTNFPTAITTERPDLVCSSLLNGKIIVVVDNSPFVLIIPGLLLDFIHTPEDHYQKAINVSFTRIIRILAMILTVFTPALYIAITTFNQQVIPDDLLISLAIQCGGVPFSTSFAVILLMTSFEILRETDMRLPDAMGTSISIVGALILGEATVSAQIVSPIVVIIIAITMITGLLFSDLDVINAFRWWRLLFLLFATFFGLIGFIVIGIIFIIKMCSIEVLGIPYLTPFSPTFIPSLRESILSFPRNKLFKRPDYLAERNQYRMSGDDDEI